MLQDVKQMPLNEGQSLASAGFFEFLMGPDKELRISGPGGVGKTFLMGNLIDTVLPMYFDTCQLMGIEPEYHSVQMTATTNKAAEVLGLQTGRPASTVHSFFGLKVMEDYGTGESKVTKSNSWQVHMGLILFIDEASMIDTPLYDLIQEGTIKCKIVYVGDKDQLAPVKEQLSPVYRRTMPMFELLEPMRTSIPELQALNQQMRDVVQSGRIEQDAFGKDVWVYDFTQIKAVPGIIDWLDGPEYEQEIINAFSGHRSDDVILAYTNNRVVEYNGFIRDLRGLPYEFQPGETLVANNAPRFGKYSMSVEDEIEIISVESTTEHLDFPMQATMEVRYAIVQNAYGESYRVPLPVDRAHYQELIKYFKRIKNWQAFFKLKGQFPDLRQRDARTVYKAQGSSHPVVYIDAENLSTCHNPSQVARQLYVAVSRARHRIVFYGDLASKYGGLIR